MVAEQRLLSYADDMVWIGRTLDEIREATREFNDLQGATGPRVNISKSAILGDAQPMTDAEDTFPVLEEVRYLGVRMSQDCKKIIDSAKIDVQRYLHSIKGKLRKANLEVK